MAACKKYRDLLVAPKDWMEEVLVCPPGFARTMSWTGMEHLRLPPSFRDPKSDWFLSYLFAIELTEPSQLNEELIGEQLLIYFRGLANGGRDKSGNEIDTKTFSIEPSRLETDQPPREFSFVLSWQEPFVNATPLKQKIRVKILTDKNEHGVLFVCGSPQSYESEVWTELLKIRSNFEAASVKARQGTGK